MKLEEIKKEKEETALDKRDDPMDATPSLDKRGPASMDTSSPTTSANPSIGNASSSLDKRESKLASDAQSSNDTWAPTPYTTATHTWERRSHSIYKRDPYVPSRPFAKKGEWVLKANSSMRVAIDFHNCLEVWNSVSPQNVKALQLMQANGYDVFLCSFCGHKREEEVRKHIASLPFTFNGLKFCRQRVGEGGKAEWCQQNSIGHLFDDTKEILEDAMKKGIEVWPIKTRHEDHQWAQHSYESFHKAAADFLLAMASRD